MVLETNRCHEGCHTFLRTWALPAEGDEDGRFLVTILPREQPHADHLTGTRVTLTPKEWIRCYVMLRAERKPLSCLEPIYRAGAESVTEVVVRVLPAAGVPYSPI